MKRLLLCGLFASGSLMAMGQVVINEVMQSNVDCVMDDQNEFPDSWVELYNAGSSAVNLSSYKIGEKDDAALAWQLPSYQLASHGYVLVYCDNTGTSGFHTDFRVDTGKDASLYLFRGSTVTDKIVGMAKQPAPNIAYGRKTDGAEEWGYQATATPNAANCGKVCDKVLGEPVFNFAGRVLTGSKTTSFTVTLSLPDDAPAGTAIRYTLDGSEPSETNGVMYQRPVTGSSTTIIRAKLICDGYLSPRSTTQSYIVFPRQMTLPVISIVTNNKYFNDSKIGIYVDGSYNSSTKNYQYNWRRPINFEMFNSPGQESVLNQLCETRISGNASRGFSLKSLALYANKRFGEKHFKYEFFPDQRPGLEKYKSLVLRNAGNDFDYLYMRDAVAQRSMGEHADMDYQAWSPAIVYINGVYKGILNIRERGNDANIYTNYDGLEDIDLLENWTVKEGDDVNKNAFQAFYTEHGHTLDEYAKWMDIDEFINYNIMQFYYNNIDYPSNNCEMWRPRTEDGKWRWIAKDVDYILGIYGQQAYSYKYLNWFSNNSFDSNYSWGNTYDATRLFRRLLEVDDFKRLFIDRMAIYMGDFLNYDAVWAEFWQPMYDKIKTEYPNHRVLINQWWPNYSDELSTAQTWMKSRTSFFYTHMGDYFTLGSPITMKVNSSWTDADREAMDISFNDIVLSKGTFNGKFYANREVTLKGTPKEGSTTGVTGWRIVTVGTNGSTTTKDVSGDAYTFTMPSCNQLMITALTGTVDAIDTPVEPTASEYAEIFDIRGVRHEVLQKGINIVRMKDGTTKKILF